MSDEASEQLDPEMVAALMPEHVRDATRARLLARAAAGQHAPDPSPATAFRKKARVPAWERSALGLALAASLIFAFLWRSERDSLRNLVSRSEAARLALADSLGLLASQHAALLDALTGPQVRMVALGAGTETSPSARMFWDQATNRWTFFAKHLPRLAAGRTYQLWLVTAAEPISAGTFAVDSLGNAVVQATYALKPGALKAVAVTDEVAGGVRLPTGTPVVLGNANE